MRRPRERMIATAEQAAAEIRASAEREASGSADARTQRARRGRRRALARYAARRSTVLAVGPSDRS